MNTFKKKSLYAALAGASALGVTGAAHAVNVNPDGLGQVLIYPYYTVQDKVAGAGFTSLLSVVNSTSSVKAVKVRFLEGRNSQEVLDFNLFLSPRDVWTAAVLPMPHATGDTTFGAGVATFDKSCTVPVVSNNASAPTPFVNYAYDGDGAGNGLDRTKEGYVEIIEMGVPTDPKVIAAAIHGNSGSPSCDGLALLTGQTPMAKASGGLFGGMTLINVYAGEDYTADAVALADFRDNGQYDLPGAITPDLTNVSPPTSLVINNANAGSVNSVIQSDWSRKINAVSAVFMHDHVYNEFVLDNGTLSLTDWIVTMPTKRYYYSGKKVQDLFQRNFTADGACDDISLNLYDREEAQIPVTVGFSPPKPGAKPNTLCWEANVIAFNRSVTPPGQAAIGLSVLGSKNGRSVTTSYQNGWGDLGLGPVAAVDWTGTAHQLINVGNTTVTTVGGGTVTGRTSTYWGLPVIGFAVQSFTNGTLTGPTGLIQSQYGGNFVHKTSRTIAVSNPAN